MTLVREFFESRFLLNLQPHRIILKHYPDWQAMGLRPKVLKSGYAKQGFYWHRNLYRWMGESIDVMAQAQGNEIHVYHGVLALLAQRYRTLLRAPEPEVLKSLTRLATMHGIAQFYLEQLVFNTEAGSSLRNQRGARGSGELDRFYAWVLYEFSSNNELDRAAVNQLLKMSLRECNIEELKNKPKEEVFEYFLTTKTLKHE